MIPQDEILGLLAPEELRRYTGLRPSHLSRPFGTALVLPDLTQDFTLGYFQPSLRDYFVADAIWTSLTLSRPFGMVRYFR
jgi:hypothetical protein